MCFTKSKKFCSNVIAKEASQNPKLTYRFFCRKAANLVSFECYGNAGMPVPCAWNVEWTAHSLQLQFCWFQLMPMSWKLVEASLALLWSLLLLLRSSQIVVRGNLAGAAASQIMLCSFLFSCFCFVVCVCVQCVLCNNLQKWLKVVVHCPVH